MSGDIYPNLCVDSIQAAPVFFSRDATIEKPKSLISKAANTSPPH